MRRVNGVRAVLLAGVTAVLAVVGTTPAVADPPDTPPPTTTTTAPTGTPTPSTPAPTPSTSTSSSPTASTPASRGIPATFTGRLEQLRQDATALQTDLATTTATAVTAITTYTATTQQVQAAVDAAAVAAQQLVDATTELDAARRKVQLVVRDSYVEQVPRAGTALLLTSDVTDIDFTVAALGYLNDRGASVYADFAGLKAKAAASSVAQQTALERAKTLQTTADTQRATALTALGEVQTHRASFAAAVTRLRDDAAKAAGGAPLSPSDSAAYAAFLAEVTALEAGVAAAGAGTTYVDGGPGLTPLPGTAWVKPILSYHQSSGYGVRDGGFHHGVDLAAPSGTPIYAVGAGTVVAAGPANGFGNWVVVDHHDGSFSIYGHSRVLATVVGAQVAPGTLIAYVGNEGESSGYHLHFEVRLGSYANATSSTDPVLWLAQRGVSL